MSNPIYFFVKIFEKREYAEDLVGGKIFCNTLGFFRQYEEKNETNRGDRHEAAVSWLQPEKVEVAINGRVLRDLAGPVLTQVKWHDHIHLYCIYAATAGAFKNISKSNIASFNDHLKIPDDCLNLGAYAVIITNAAEFIKRVRAEIERKRFGLKAGLVDYYDPSSFHGSFDDEYAMFNKRQEYKHQREYRFAIESGFVNGDPLVLQVGDLSDIAVVVESKKVNSLIEAKLPE